MIAELRDLLARATKPPWRWAGYQPPGRFELPEIRTRHGGQHRVLAFVPAEAVRVIHADGLDPARNVTVAGDVEAELLDRLRETPPETITVDEDGHRDPVGEYLAYAERAYVMAFQHPAGFVAPIGDDVAQPRWDCLGGKTAAECAREPYRFDITGIDHPDPTLLVAAVNALPALLDVAEAAAAFAAAREDLFAMAAAWPALERAVAELGEPPEAAAA